jgi:hypothetical protein
MFSFGIAAVFLELIGRRTPELLSVRSGTVATPTPVTLLSTAAPLADVLNW